jgi:CRP-like cAMP-binding protein
VVELSQMEPSALKKIEKYYASYKIEEYKKGEIIIRSFENPNKVYFLSKGSVKMYSISKSGKEFVFNIFKPYSFFPMSLAVNGGENLYYFEAMTPVNIKAAPYKKTVNFLKDNPDVMFDLLKRIYKGIDGLLIKIDFAMTSNAKSRVIIELIAQAKRFGSEKNGKYELETSISGLATNVGLARETVSRQLKVLKEKKLIKIVKKRIIISDLSKLAEEVG